MSTITLNPYLFFAGNCRQAMEFYREVFSGNLDVKTFGDGPPDAHSDAKANSEEVKALVMHARLDGDVVLLASDNPRSEGEIKDRQFSISLEGTDEGKLKGYFDRLSEGGQVLAPLGKQFWGAVFGMVTDQFGITWMISINQTS